MIDNQEYRKGMKVKEKIYREHKLRLLSITPEDMKNMDEVLRYKLNKFSG